MTKQKKITAAVALIAVIAIVIVSIFLMSGNAGGAANVQEIAIEELEPLSKEEGSALSGVCDHTISLGETDDLESLIEQDDTIVEKIEIDADNVDFEKAGEYEATYQITFDMEALNEWLDENERSVSFQTDTDPVIVKTTATITVQEDTAKTSDGSKDTKKPTRSRQLRMTKIPKAAVLQTVLPIRLPIHPAVLPAAPRPSQIISTTGRHTLQPGRLPKQ